MADATLFEVDEPSDGIERSARLSRCVDDQLDDDHDREACDYCDVYRYELRRVWGPGELLVWIMLNPSKADGRVDDATIRKVMRLTRKWWTPSGGRYGGIVVLNLYALRATDRRKLWHHPDPIGPENDSWLLDVDAERVICAWGADGLRGEEVLAQLVERGVQPYCLAVTAGGQPRHPLYLKETLRPVPLAVGATRTGGSR
jgi:hypothetical protein